MEILKSEDIQLKTMLFSLKANFLFFILINLLFFNTVNATGPYVAITHNETYYVGEKFSLPIKVVNDDITPAYNVSFVILPSDGLVIFGDSIIKIDKLNPKSEISHNFSLGARKIGKHDFRFQFIGYDFRGEPFPGSYKIHTIPVKIIECNLSICPDISWTKGNFVCYDRGYLSIWYNETGISKEIQIPFSFEKPPSDYKDLIANINYFDVDVISNNNLKVRFEFSLENKSGSGRKMKTNILKNAIFIDFDRDNHLIKNLKINEDIVHKKSKGYFYVCSHDVEICATCIGEFYEPRVLSAINVDGESIDYPFETERTYTLMFEIDNAFRETENGTYFSKFGIFLPVTVSKLSEVSVKLGSNFEGNASLIQWTGKSLTQRQGNVFYEVVSGPPAKQNLQKTQYFLKKEGDYLRLNIEFSNIILHDYGLLEYNIKLRGKEKLPGPVPWLDRFWEYANKIITLREVLLTVLAVMGAIWLCVKKKKKIIEWLQRRLESRS